MWALGHAAWYSYPNYWSRHKQQKTLILQKLAWTKCNRSLRESNVLVGALRIRGVLKHASGPNFLHVNTLLVEKQMSVLISVPSPLPAVKSHSSLPVCNCLNPVIYEKEKNLCADGTERLGWGINILNHEPGGIGLPPSPSLIDGIY